MSYIYINNFKLVISHILLMINLITDKLNLIYKYKFKVGNLIILIGFNRDEGYLFAVRARIFLPKGLIFLM